MENKYLGSTGLAKLLERLFETFSEVGHTHTKSQISDFPTVPTNTSQLTNDSGFITANDLSGNVTVDSELSDISLNPVQNKVIKSEFDTVKGQIDDIFADKVGVTPQSLTAEQRLQARTNIGALSSDNMDSEPKSGSVNPVTSGGLFSKFATQDENIEMASMTANMAMPGSLKWDGYVGDRECVIIGEDQVAEGVTCRAQFVHVSDYVPETLFLMLSEFPAEARTFPAMCSMSGIDTGEMHEIIEMQAQAADDMFIMSQGFFYVPTDGYFIEGFTFPKKGWYFMSESACMGDIEMPMMYISGLKLGMVVFPDNADKYFETVEKAGIVTSDTLTWDGDTTGRVCNSNKTFFKISDVVLTDSDLVNGIKYTASNGYGGYISYEDLSSNIFDDGRILIDASIMVVPIDNYNLDGTIYPESGIYFLGRDFGSDGGWIYVASFTVPGYNFPYERTVETKVIKYEHLPKALQFGEMPTGGDTMAWDGNTEGLPVISVELEGEMTEILYKISDAIPSASDLTNGMRFRIKREDNVVQETEMPKEGFIYFDNGNIASEGLIVVAQANVEFEPYGDGVVIIPPETGIYVINPMVFGLFLTAITIPGYTGFPSVKKIDQKYLPDGFGGEGGGLPEVSTEDNGKFLRVVNGAPAWASIPNAEEATF